MYICRRKIDHHAFLDDFVFLQITLVYPDIFKDSYFEIFFTRPRTWIKSYIRWLHQLVGRQTFIQLFNYSFVTVIRKILIKWGWGAHIAFIGHNMLSLALSLSRSLALSLSLSSFLLYLCKLYNPSWLSNVLNSQNKNKAEEQCREKDQ